jgi:enamine deaminase RidA (YjgF/YER057c/UK114 family)
VAEGVPLPLGAPCHAIRAGELVFVGAVDAPEDTAAPATIILERLDAVLRAAGLGLKDSFRHWAFLRNMAAASVRDAYRTSAPSARSVFAPDSFRPIPGQRPALGRALRSAHALASAAADGMSRQSLPRAAGAFAQGVRVRLAVRTGRDAVDARSSRPSLACAPRPSNACGGCGSCWRRRRVDDIVKPPSTCSTARTVRVPRSLRRADRRRLQPWMPARLTMTVDALRGCLVEIDAVAYLKLPAKFGLDRPACRASAHGS